VWQYKGYHFPRDIYLLAWIGVLLLYYDCLIRFRPLPDILKKIHSHNKLRLESDSRPPTEAQLQTMDKIYRGATFWLTRIGRSMRPCLRRSLVLYHWSAAQGLCSRVVIGARKDGSDLLGHSWLMLDGCPFNEEPELLAQYTVFLEG